MNSIPINEHQSSKLRASAVNNSQNDSMLIHNGQVVIVIFWCGMFLWHFAPHLVLLERIFACKLISAFHLFGDSVQP